MDHASDKFYTAHPSRPVTLAYNLPELPITNCEGIEAGSTGCLHLSQEVLVGIFNGSVTQWNDEMIVTINPAMKEANQSIIVVVRADSSGASQIFTRALSSFDSNWDKRYSSFQDGMRSKNLSPLGIFSKAQGSSELW